MLVGIDLVQVSQVKEALSHFGRRYCERIYTAGERAYADAADGPTRWARYAARFAAKEAALKVLRPGRLGLGWQTLEVVRLPNHDDAPSDVERSTSQPTELAAADPHANETLDSGPPELVLHGPAKALSEARGIRGFALSLSHDGDYATAVVIAEQHVVPARGIGVRSEDWSHESTHAPRPPLPRNARSTGGSLSALGTRRGASSMLVSDKVRNVLKAHGRITKDVATIGDDDDLFKLGLSSQASVNVMLALENEFDVEFPDRMLKREVFGSIASLSAALAELQEGKG